MPSNPAKVSLSFLQLIKISKQILAKGRQKTKEVLSEMFHSLGGHISEYELNGSDRAKYGEHLFDHLSKELGISKRNLYDAVRFAREFPIVQTSAQLGWSNVRDILALSDKKARKVLIQKVTKENISNRDLKLAIAYQKTLMIPKDAPIAQLKFTRGRLNVYQMIKSNSSFDNAGKLVLDLGFRMEYFVENELKGLKEEETVEIKFGERPVAIERIKVSTDKIFTYQAKVEKMPDADTHVVSFNFHLPVSLTQKLRLRGIDCPEIKTPAGRKAKRFVAARLGKCKFIIVKTYKDRSDKFDRYLSDIFYLPGETDPAKVAAEGIYLNQELLDNRLAVIWK